MRSRRAALAAAATVVAVAAVGGLAASTVGDETPSGAQARPAAAAAVSRPNSPQAVGVQPDQVAPAVVGVARRGGEEVDAHLAARPAALGATSAYPDGTVVAVRRTGRETVTGQGPGSINTLVTIFTITVTNRSDTALDLSSVVVTGVYGSAPRLIADPNYDLDVQDFSGVLAPGTAATARYGFSIPTNSPGDVSLSVDLDSSRTPAVFTGTAN